MEIVLVTAGNSFVGQHFIKHLQLYGPPTLKEIRVLDGKPFENRLKYDSPIPVKSFIGTVFDSTVLSDALNNVDTVVHLHELKDTSMLPDIKSMKRINVEGTRLVLDACKIRPNVKRFLLRSSSDVMLCNHLACDANVSESWVVPEGNWAYPDYCASKYEAEKILSTYDSFQYFVVQFGPMYGELDDEEWGFNTNLKLGKRFGGAVPILGDRLGDLQFTYVGNATYGMVKVLDKMVADPTATKETIFLLDDTPLVDLYSLLEPIANAKKYRLVPLPVWFMVIFIPYSFLEKFAHWTENFHCFGLKSVFRKLPAARVLYNYCYNYTFFSNFKGLMYIGYRPLYDQDTVLNNCIKYYADEDL